MNQLNVQTKIKNINSVQQDTFFFTNTFIVLVVAHTKPLIRATFLGTGYPQHLIRSSFLKDSWGWGGGGEWIEWYRAVHSLKTKKCIIEGSEKIQKLGEGERKRGELTT